VAKKQKDFDKSQCKLHSTQLIFKLLRPKNTSYPFWNQILKLVPRQVSIIWTGTYSSTHTILGLIYS